MRVKKGIKYLLVTFIALASLIMLVFGVLFGSFVLANYEWAKIDPSTNNIYTRLDVENRLILAIKTKYSCFSELEAGHYLWWNEEKKEYQGSYLGNRFVYKPQLGDQYLTYRILGVMPIDVIYDNKDNLIYCAKSFDY